MSNSSTQRTKACWTPAYHKIFVDLCLEQILKGNRPRTHFTKEGWRNIVESFHKKTGLRYNKIQFKNHLDSIKQQWTVWSKLIGTSSMKWDPNTNKFGASEEDWANYIQANTEAAQFRSKELQFTDKLETIFDGTMVTGDTCSSTTSPLHTEGQGIATPDMKNECPCDAVKPRSSLTVQCRHHRIMASEESMSSSLPLKAKANWMPALHKIFVDLCLEQTLKGDKPGMHFTRKGWRNILESFHKKAGLRYDRMQLRNHWDVTKQQWKVWCKLIGTSDMKWDPNTNKFGASEEDWANYIGLNPEAAQYQFKELQFIDKLEIIYDRTTCIGETEPPRAAVAEATEPPGTFTGEMEPPTQRRRHNDSLTNSVLHTNEPEIAKPDGKSEQLCVAVESRSAVTLQSTRGKLSNSFMDSAKRSYSIGECIECLDGMEEVEQGSDLYLFALDIFLKKEYREIFLQLKKHSVRIAWLQRLQSVSPTLH